jgi:hypothetical protein
VLLERRIVQSIEPTEFFDRGRDRRNNGGIELAHEGESASKRARGESKLDMLHARMYWRDTALMNKKRHSKSRRELIDTGNEKRYVRRDEKGRFDEVADVGRSLAADRRQHAKTTVPSGQGDRGDQERSKR